MEILEQNKYNNSYNLQPSGTKNTIVVVRNVRNYDYYLL